MSRAGQMSISRPAPSPAPSEYYDDLPSPSRQYGALGLGSPGRRERGHIGATGGREANARSYRPIGPLEMDYSASPTHDYLESFTRPSFPYHSTELPTSPSGGSDIFYSSPNLANSPSEKFLGDTGRHNSSRLLKTEYPSRGDMGGVEYNAYKASYKEPRGCVPSNPTKRRWLFWGVPIGLVIAAGIAVGVAVAVTHKGTTKGSSRSGSGTGGTGSGTGTGTGGNGSNDGNNNFGVAASGSDGSTVTMDDGTSFVYSNSFGGNWAVNPYNPYSVSGRAQEFTPSLLEPWQWGTDQIRGVNLGGWLVTEAFIVPALYERYQNATPQAVDEWTLCQAMGANVSAVMEEHYKTFITEQDFADIAAAGLNWLRIPLGYWAIETTEDEAYLPKVSWTYFLKAIEWARKYGLRILLDFHALPGSQNGWNHSGHQGAVNWMYGVMGVANAQRSLEQIRSLVQFISQDGIKQVVPMLGLVNEVQSAVVGHEVLGSFYYEAYQMVRSITGYGAGNGPILAMHEGFEGIGTWAGFLSGADRVALDQHPYLAFGTQNNNPYSANAVQACGWGGGTNDSSTNFGITIGGEWSLAINNCGKWLNGVGTTPSYEGSGLGACLPWEDWRTFTQDRKDGMASYALSNMDALQNWFFWTWRIGNSTERGYAPSPMWHYQLGLQQGWLPKDPRTAGGYCKNVLNVGGDQFAGTYPASAIGNVATPSIAAAQTASYGIWPPQSLGPSPSFAANQVALFPTLTQTGTPIVLPTPTHPSNVTAGNGWAFPADTQRAYVRVNGCPYPDEYNATDAALAPTARCTGTPAKRGLVTRITSAPGR